MLQGAISERYFHILNFSVVVTWRGLIQRDLVQY